mmetsp:Transcript_48799/g.152649  ORF Transcript_48799/g.152649 Transcript_48799/m.152649 type:complete len:549 (+) Transcript_48799:73-1719(+)
MPAQAKPVDALRTAVGLQEEPDLVAGTLRGPVQRVPPDGPVPAVPMVVGPAEPAPGVVAAVGLAGVQGHLPRAVEQDLEALPTGGRQLHAVVVALSLVIPGHVAHDPPVVPGAHDAVLVALGRGPARSIARGAEHHRRRVRAVQQREGRDGVLRCRCPGGGAADAEREVHGLVADVQHDQRDGGVWVEEGSGVQLLVALQRTANSARDAFRAGLQVPREVAYVVVARLHVHRVPLRVHEERCRAEVALVVGATNLVQYQVPVDPGLGPVTEVPDDIQSVPLREGPVALVGPALLAGLGHDQVLVRPQLVRPEHVLEADLPRLVRPTLVARVAIPVEGYSPDILGSHSIGVDDARPSEHVVAVVVPHQELDVHAAALQGRAEVVAHEVALLLGREEAALPAHWCVGLVLHGHRPHGQAATVQLPRKLHVVPRPHLAVLRLEDTASHHAAGVLHPRWWTPRARHDLQQLARGRVRAVDEGDDGPPISCYGEAMQLLVASLWTARPVTPREVAGVDVRAAHPVAEPNVRAEVGLDHLLLSLATQLQQELGR